MSHIELFAYACLIVAGICLAIGTAWQRRIEARWSDGEGMDTTRMIG